MSTIKNKEEQKQDEKILALEKRIMFLEERLLSYYKNRWDVLDKIADYLVGTQIPGDYAEFGVFNGKTFAYAYKVLATLFPSMKFLAFDSFEGLPEPKGLDATENYTSGFYKGQFACDLKSFKENMKNANIDLSRVRFIDGWFEQTLKPENPKSASILKVSAAWIDCDLYESTIPVLHYLSSRLSVGSVILFDDWRCFRNLAHLGQQRACAEWLRQNPNILLNSFVDFGFHGKAFTIAAC